jgi:hypothetical protein
MLPFAVNFGPSDDELVKFGLLIIVGTVAIALALALVVALICRKPRFTPRRPIISLDDQVRELWLNRMKCQELFDPEHRKAA